MENKLEELQEKVDSLQNQKKEEIEKIKADVQAKQEQLKQEIDQRMDELANEGITYGEMGADEQIKSMLAKQETIEADSKPQIESVENKYNEQIAKITEELEFEKDRDARIKDLTSKINERIESMQSNGATNEEIYLDEKLSKMQRELEEVKEEKFVSKEEKEKQEKLEAERQRLEKAKEEYKKLKAEKQKLEEKLAKEGNTSLINQRNQLEEELEKLKAKGKDAKDSEYAEYVEDLQKINKELSEYDKKKAEIKTKLQKVNNRMQALEKEFGKDVLEKEKTVQEPIAPEQPIVTEQPTTPEQTMQEPVVPEQPTTEPNAVPQQDVEDLYQIFRNNPAHQGIYPQSTTEIPENIFADEEAHPVDDSSRDTATIFAEPADDFVNDNIPAFREITPTEETIKTMIDKINVRYENGQIVYEAELTDPYGMKFTEILTQEELKNTLKSEKGCRKYFFEKYIQGMAGKNVLPNKILKNIDPMICQLIGICADKYGIERPDKLLHDYGVGFSNDEELTAESSTNLPISYDISRQEIDKASDLSRKDRRIINRICKTAKQSEHPNISVSKYKTRWETIKEWVASRNPFNKNRALNSAQTELDNNTAEQIRTTVEEAQAAKGEPEIEESVEGFKGYITQGAPSLEEQAQYVAKHDDKGDTMQFDVVIPQDKERNDDENTI